MKLWSYIINSDHKTADIILSDVSSLVYSLDVVVENFCSYIPAWIPIIPFPVRLNKIIANDYNNGKRWVWSHNWYGNFGSVFCALVHNPISNFCCKRTREKLVPIDYDEAKKLFYVEDKEFWDEEEKFKFSRFNEEKEGLENGSSKV